MMKNKGLLSLWICMTLVLMAKGQVSFAPAYIISSDTASYVVLPFTNFQSMSDPGEDLTLEQAIRSSAFNSAVRPVNYRIQVYWQRFSMINHLGKTADISLPETSFRAELYTKINNGKWESFRTGTGVAWSHRDGLKRIPAFRLSIPPGDTLTVYKRTYWDYVAAQPDTLSIFFSFTNRLIEYNYIEDNSYNMTAMQDAFILGMFILSVVINFFFFWVVREKEFLYFILFLVLFSIQALCSLTDVFLREDPELQLYLYILTNSLASWMLVQFIRHFLKTFSHFPRWDKYLFIYSYIQVGVVLFSSIASAVLKTNLAALSHTSENSFKLLYGISLLVTLLLYLRNKESNVKLMIIGLLPLLLLQVTAYGLAVVFGLYYPRFAAPDISGYDSAFNRNATFIMILSYLWMMVFFTWVLFLRFSILRKKLARQASLDHLKSRFFANISHEFRTPLTLIIGPIEDLLKDKSARKFNEPLQYVHRNSKKLLQLINQLLDLSKLDVGRYQVNTTHEDVIPFVKQIVHSFSSMAQRRNILLDTEVDPRLKEGLKNEAVWFYFDEDIIEKIMSNLISNAFKFTPDGGSIIVSIFLADKGMLGLKVEDSGTGIPPGKLPFIFDRFYQADSSRKRAYEGTGIGLALVKELVELHRGNIEVESLENKGTIFSCYFPFNQKILSEGGKAGLPQREKDTPETGELKNDPQEETFPLKRFLKVLVVEDQQDVRRYICDKLEGIYSVLEARDGKEGLELATQYVPDLVISDVMMPQMDGFELCQLLKTDDITCHIPVILVTARAEDEDKLNGLQTGADAYLIKPFNSEELLLRVHNLIELRNRLRKKFSGKLVVKPSEITVSSQDSQFMERLLDTVEKHMDDEKFSVEQLGREFGMSPSQINRKLKAIINQSSGSFIRSVRMERAMVLLKNDQATIAEVAYATGFSEPAYFSRVFKAYFGHPPSDLRKEGM